VRVLVVDDEPDIRRLLSKALAGRGIEVDAEATAAGALVRLRAQRYDGMFLDVLMPGTSGDQVLPAVLAAQPRLPVLMLSALNEPRTRVRCLEQGAVDYIVKPFVLAELVARLNVHTRGAAKVPPPVDRRTAERRLDDRRALDTAQTSAPRATSTTPRRLRHGSVTLDTHRRTVRVGDTLVGLSERENLLLSHLLRRAGEVCTREEILADVWGVAGGHTDNVVDVYVARLRAKLPPDSITTVRNSGYAFGAA